VKGEVNEERSGEDRGEKRSKIVKGRKRKWRREERREVD